MSFVVVDPGFIAVAASKLAGIGSAIGAANAAAASTITRVAAAGGDEVSAAIAALFGAHGRAYQAAGAEAVMFQEEFVRVLAMGGEAYAAAEIANVERQLLSIVNGPTQLLLGRGLVGAGADGVAPGEAGGAGGLLWGNGGRGAAGAAGQAGGLVAPRV